MSQSRPKPTALSLVIEEHAARQVALASARKNWKAAAVFGLPALAMLWGAVALSSTGFAITAIVFLGFAALMLVSSRTSQKKAARSRVLQLPAAVRDRVARLRFPVHPNVHWRLERALDAHVHLSAFLSHAQRQRPVAWADALATDASTCLLHVVDRCRALVDLHAIPGASPTVEASIATIEAEVDRHLVELGGAMDATATYIAVGTRDAAQALQRRAEHLQDLVAGLNEVFSPGSADLQPAPAEAQHALPAGDGS